MKFSHCCAGILAIVAGVVGVTSLLVDSSDKEYSPFQRYRDLNSIFAENERRIALDRQLADSRERVHIREMIASRLEAGKLTLFEAAVAFAHIDEASPGALWDRQKCPGASEAEKQCRLVIHWMGLRMASNHTDEVGEQIRQRLEAELQEHLERNGGVVELPEYVDLAKLE